MKVRTPASPPASPNHACSSTSEPSPFPEDTTGLLDAWQQLIKKTSFGQVWQQAESQGQGGLYFSTSSEDRQTYGRDWTKAIPPRPCAIVFPRTAEHVQEILRCASQVGLPVVPSGGRTGLAGGAVAPAGELVVNLKYLNHLGAVDPAALTVEVGAGAITEAVHLHVHPYGLTWPVDFASKGSSQVGGNIATNAGGVHVLRYGLTRQWVLGLDVVLSTGERLRLNGALEKNNTGLDLRQLFIGTEGIYGIIVGATLKLHPLPGPRVVALVGVETMEQVLDLFAAARKGPATLMAYEYFSDVCLRTVLDQQGWPSPFVTVPSYTVLLDWEGPRGAEDGTMDDGTLASIESWLIDQTEEGRGGEVLLSQNDAQAKQFWAYREVIAESLFSRALLHKNDIALPLAQLKSFCGQLDSFFSTGYPHWTVAHFGHIGDGNLHLNVLKPDGVERDVFLEETHEVDRSLFALVKQHQGSISAEHGIGLLKKDFLSFSRSETEIELMRRMKGVLDPKGILNPGKIF